jgi:hypothetical protein
MSGVVSSIPVARISVRAVVPFSSTPPSIAFASATSERRTSIP